MELTEYRTYTYRDTLKVTRGHGGMGLEGVTVVADRIGLKSVVVPWQDIDVFIDESGCTGDDRRVYETPWWDVIVMGSDPVVAIFDAPQDRPDLIKRFERFVDSEGTVLVVLGVDDMPDERYARRIDSCHASRTPAKQ